MNTPVEPYWYTTRRLEHYQLLLFPTLSNSIKSKTSICLCSLRQAMVRGTLGNHLNYVYNTRFIVQFRGAKKRARRLETSYSPGIGHSVARP